MDSSSVRTSKLSILEQIVVRKRAELLLDRARAPLATLEARAKAARPRGFRRALEQSAPAVIAEIKKASPSRGVIAEDVDPAETARRYEAAGAAALSVLTDQVFFQGTLTDLEAARGATRLPVLRKDFTLDRYHLWQAAAHGADAVLLIVAILKQGELRDLLAEARDLGLDVLVEVHDRPELDRALEAGADLVGVNNRNLQTFEVTLETSLRLAEAIPRSVLAVSESGLRRPEDLERLAAAGFRAFLIGESLMSQPDPGAALEALLAGVRSSVGNH
jgi:indole-3-glycerol phosphate synthase